MIPTHIENIEQLEAILSTPSTQLIEMMTKLEGDILILGAGGKMGPSLAKRARNAVEQSGKQRAVIAVSRFTDIGVREDLMRNKIETIVCDLLEEASLLKLPAVRNVIFMAGRKFGSTGNESLTWAMNTFLPAIVARRFRASNIVALSTGNVYPMMPVGSGGSKESDPTEPIGEYAQSCLGRERMIQYMSDALRIPSTIIRLNYAIDLRYGVLHDVARKIYQAEPIDLRMGFVNVIWQGDANEIILRALNICSVPPTILNVTGCETLPIEWLAREFGRRFDRKPTFAGSPATTALLSDASAMKTRFGAPRVPIELMLDWIAHWIAIGGKSFNKPTHFEEREGKF